MVEVVRGISAVNSGEELTELTEGGGSLSATLKIIFMLWEEQKPPALRWMSRCVEVEIK